MKKIIHIFLASFFLTFIVSCANPKTSKPNRQNMKSYPIIDIHMHTFQWDKYGNPRFALAEELDIPVCLHTGFGPPMSPYMGDPNFRMRHGNPLLLEDVLVKHPRLRIYIAQVNI